MYKKLFTSESVGAGHPDKICDQISDAILDNILRQDPEARVACEVMASNHLIVIGGEIKTSGYVDTTKVAWSVLKKLGYKENDFSVLVNVNTQSENINSGVNKKSGEIGAGDQGMVFGYATNETKEYMPLSITLAHELVKIAESHRLKGEFDGALSDMKSQVTLDYSHSPTKIHTILMSIQHKDKINKKVFEKYIKDKIILPVVKKYNLNTNFKIIINPAGDFIIGGPFGDTGLTGRKIVVDTYGGVAHHGGGAFSGKDYTKVDRSGAYAARWVAKNLVAAGVSKMLEVQISYGIGMINPISISVDTFETETIGISKIEKIINEVFDLSPKGIIESLNLKKPIYQKTSTFGHFGRDDITFSWEKLNKVKEIKKLMG